LAATKALQLGKDWHDELNESYAKRRTLAMQLLESINCKAAPGQAGMFIWAAIPSSYKDCYELSDEILYGNNVFITPGGIFGTAGDKYIRVSLCSTEEKLKQAIGRIQKIKA
jgi:aspartate/methionine/tyrosine aminotransferase